MQESKVLLYIDTSALLPYYRQEALSEQVESLLQAASGRIAVSRLTEVEVFSALARWRRMGELAEIDAQRIQDEFEAHLAQNFYLILPLSEEVFQQAKYWLSRRDTALRTLDALHLAGAHGSGAELVSADDKLIQAAQVFGIRCRYLCA
jgi:uncharacterized protein